MGCERQSPATAVNKNRHTLNRQGQEGGQSVNQLVGQLVTCDGRQQEPAYVEPTRLLQVRNRHASLRFDLIRVVRV